MKRAATALCLLIAGLTVGLHLKFDRSKSENSPAIEKENIADSPKMTPEQKRQNIYKDAGYLVKVRGFQKIMIPLTKQAIYLDEGVFGSGFITDDKGLCKKSKYCIVTAFHVVNETSLSYFAESKDGSTAKLMELAYGTTHYDFAILNFSDKKFIPKKTARIGKSSKMIEGSAIYAMGSNVFGNFWYSTSGHIFTGIKPAESELKLILSKSNMNHPEVILFDTPIFEGFSGGPLFNENGEVIGIAISSIKLGQEIIYIGTPIDGIKKALKKMK